MGIEQYDRSLTLKYSLHQIVFWAAVGGYFTYAVSYFTGKGYSAAAAGWVLFAAYMLSFVLQPLVGALADKSRRFILPQLILTLSLINLACFMLVRFAALPAALFFALYIIGAMVLDMQIPLLNSLVVYYSAQSMKINYGLARGIGGFGFAVATLCYGCLIEYFGADIMIITAMVYVLLILPLAMTYPRSERSSSDTTAGSGEGCSLFGFIKKYKWYCTSLIGVFLLALFHIMAETYLIEILGRVGGSNANVGVCLFIATATELPSMMLYPLILKRTGIKKLLLVSGLFYTLKALLLIFAGSVTAVYIIQPLQCVTYVLLSMSQMYYAEECTSAQDMIKGQSMITAFYTFGCAVGCLLGGEIVTSSGISAMLFTGLAVAALGLAVFLLTIPKALRRG